MPYSIETSEFSFLQFGESDYIQACNWAPIHLCLPIVDEDDVWFQFVIKADTEEEADELCDQDNASIRVGIAISCADDAVLFLQKPTRYRISPVRVLYHWPHGVPGLTTLLDIGQCFRFKIEAVNVDNTYCSNCFQRIASACFTNVVQYYNDENAFGFNYCASANADQEVADNCDPTIFEFTNIPTLTIPYTAFLQNKYGNTPTVEAWLYDGSDLVKAGIVIELDQYPPTQIYFDFGGTASGIIKIM